MNISLTLQSMFRFLLIDALLLLTIPRSTNIVYAQAPIQALVPDPTFGTAGTLQLPNDYVLTFAQVVSDHVVIRQTIHWPAFKSHPDDSNRLCRVEMSGQLGNCTEWVRQPSGGPHDWRIEGIQSDGHILYLGDQTQDSEHFQLLRLNADLSADTIFNAAPPFACYSYFYITCFFLELDDHLLRLASGYDSANNAAITTTRYFSNGVFERSNSIVEPFVHHANGYSPYLGYIDGLQPISASVPISSQIYWLYVHQTPIDVPPCRWEVFTSDLQSWGSVDLIQTQQPCITTTPVAHPDGGLVWMELARDQGDVELGRQIYKTRPNFSIDTDFGINGVVTALLASAGPITNSQILVQPDGRLLALFEKREGWLLKQFDRNGSHEQWLALLASDVAPVLTADGKIITRRGNVMARYHKITVANLDQRVLLPVIAR